MVLRPLFTRHFLAEIFELTADLTIWNHMESEVKVVNNKPYTEQLIQLLLEISKVLYIIVFVN